MSRPTSDADALLTAHLRAWLAAWPPGARLDVVGSPARQSPGWDGKVHPLVGVGSPDLGVVLSVGPPHVDALRRHLRLADGDGHADRRSDVTVVLGDPSAGALLGRSGHVVGAGVLRWSTSVAGPDVLADAGEWVARDDRRVPPWLRVFNGGVLLAVDEEGYVAGVGLKAHDDVAREIAVVTEPRGRGRGLARRLVAQAARRVLEDGRLPTYLHDRANVASGKVADAVGFPDRGWSVYGLFESG